MSPLYKLYELGFKPISTRLSASGIKFVQVDEGIYVGGDQHVALIDAYAASPADKYVIHQRIKDGSLDAGTIQYTDGTLFLRNKSAHFSPTELVTRFQTRDNFAGQIAEAVGARDKSVQTIRDLQSITDIEKFANWPEARIVLPK